MNADQLAVNSPATSPRPDGAPTLRIRAVMLGERINPSGIEMGATVSSTPAAFRVHAGLAVIFRYGVVVLIGLLPSEEKVLIDSLKPRVIGEFSPYEEDRPCAALQGRKRRGDPAGRPDLPRQILRRPAAADRGRACQEHFARA